MKKTKENLLKLLVSFFPYLSWVFKFRINVKNSLVKTGFKENLWALRKGFFPETVKLCRITKENVNEYLSDRTYLELHPINKSYSKIIDNKLFLPLLFKDYPDLVPQYYYLLDKGRLVKLDLERSVDEGLLNLCKEKHFLVLKPCSSSMGDGFYRLEWRYGKLFLNNDCISNEDLESFISALDQYLIMEFIEQHKYSAKINPECANTIRLLCIWDYLTKGSIISSAFHRFGVNNKNVDNLGARGDGLLVLIDIDTGTIKDTGIIKQKGESLRYAKIIMHPDSKEPVAGVHIPGWLEMKGKVLSVMNQMSFLKYVGIDIVITEGGFKILELNSLPNLFGVQLEQGLLSDERTRYFFLSSYISKNEIGG